MDVVFVEDEGGMASAEGFIECCNAEKTRFVRVPGAKIQLTIETPTILKVVSYRALKDAHRTETTPAFPGQQCSPDLERSTATVLSGTASISGLGGRRKTTISTLGMLHNLAQMEVRLESAKEVAGFHVDWFSEEYVQPDGGFLLNGYLVQQDIDLLAEELRTTDGTLVIELNIGCFPGFFGEWSFEGWDGGKIKFANRKICSCVVANHETISDDFFDPVEPFDSRVYTAGPHDLVTLMVVKDRASQEVG